MNVLQLRVLHQLHNKLRLHLILNTHRHQQLYYHHLNQLCPGGEPTVSWEMRPRWISGWRYCGGGGASYGGRGGRAEEYSQAVGDRGSWWMPWIKRKKTTRRGYPWGRWSVEVVGDQVAVVGFSLVVDIIVEHQVDGLSLNQGGWRYCRTQSSVLVRHIWDRSIVRRVYPVYGLHLGDLVRVSHDGGLDCHVG